MSKSLSQWPLKPLYFKLSWQKSYYKMRLKQPFYNSGCDIVHFVPSKRTVGFKEQLAIVWNLTPSLSRIVDYRSTVPYLGFQSPTSSENRKFWPKPLITHVRLHFYLSAHASQTRVYSSLIFLPFFCYIVTLDLIALWKCQKELNITCG
jgi:hypothetical protein